MSYSHSMGAITIPPDLRAQTMSGGPLQTQSMTVISAQCALKRRGVIIGQDGKFGPETKLKLGDALRGFRRTGEPFAEYAAFDEATTKGATRLNVTSNFRSWLYRGYASCASLPIPSRTPAPGPSAPGPSAPAEEPATEEEGALIEVESAGSSLMPWAVAAGGLVLVGGFFVWKKRKKKVAPNRRRRTTRRRR